MHTVTTSESVMWTRMRFFMMKKAVRGRRGSFCGSDRWSWRLW